MRYFISPKPSLFGVFGHRLVLRGLATTVLLCSLASLPACGGRSPDHDSTQHSADTNSNRPLAANDRRTVQPNSGDNVFVSLLDNDSANTADNVLTITAVSMPASGATRFDAMTGTITYTLDDGVSDATDSFTYTIENSAGESAMGTVFITVSAVTNVGNAPVTAPDVLTINTNSPQNVVDVLANDSDADGDDLTVNSAGTNGASVEGGKVRLRDTDADGELDVVYEPPFNFAGEDTFSYTVTDGLNTVSETVTVTINAFNPAQRQLRPCEAEAAERKAAGRPYCFDIGIPSGFTAGADNDGHTIWATVFVPAAHILEADEKPPVLLHAHGFGESRFASLENPNDFMEFRVTAQALLELWHEGYWVISFDQRGFNASGLWGPSTESSNNTSNETCMTQDDPSCIDVMSPEREARDATAVMDWIGANLCEGIADITTDVATAVQPLSQGCPVDADGNDTELYAFDEKGDPKLGTIGLSYGGGWQMMGAPNDKVLNPGSRTNDTRIDAMVPVTTWHDLRYSLFPNDVPKSGWLQFLTTATQLGGTTLASDGFLAFAGVAANLDAVDEPASAAAAMGRSVYEGLYARSMRSYCEGAGDDTFATDDDLRPLAGAGNGTGSTASNNSLGGPAVLMIQGQRDTLFNFNEAYDIAQCYQAANPNAQVKLLVQTEGHILATTQAPSYKDADTPDETPAQVIYIDETVFCDDSQTPLNTRQMIAGFFRENLGVVDDSVTPLDSGALPAVCVTHYAPNAAPGSGLAYASLDDVIIGGDLTVAIDSNDAMAGAQAAGFIVAAGAPGSGDADGITPPPPLYQQVLATAADGQQVVGIPTANLTITATTVPTTTKPPRFFMGLAISNTAGMNVIADQVTPITGELADVATQCTTDGCVTTFNYPRAADNVGHYPEQHGEGTGRLAGFATKLNDGDSLVLVIYGQHPSFNLHSSPGYTFSVEGEVRVPIVP